MHTINKVSIIAPTQFEVELDNGHILQLKEWQPLLTTHGWKRPDQLRPHQVIPNVWDNPDAWDEQRYPLRQAKRLVDVRHWPESELRKYIPSSKSIERLQNGTQHVRWLRPMGGKPYYEGARVVDGGTALELYWSTGCRVVSVRYGDEDQSRYCPEWKRKRT